MRHRVSIHDLAALVAVMSVLVYIALAYDVFTTEGTVSIVEERIELDEMLLLGVMLGIGLLTFGVRRYLEQKNEVRRRRVAEAQAHELAFRDPLTSLANRRQFLDTLTVACASPPASGSTHAVLMLDLNGFKKINDNYGHAIGDEVLIIVAQRLLSAVDGDDLIARLGGDEFVILCQHLLGPEAASNIASRIIDALSTPIKTGNVQHHVGSGVGIALVGEGESPTEVMRKADVALYRAKAERRSAVRFFEEEMDRAVHARDEMERALKAAMIAGHIQPRFQPAVDLRSGAVVGFEVFPSWITEAGEEIASDRFLAAAEESGLIHELAGTVLRRACAAARDWPGHLTLSFNILPSQITDINLGLSIIGIVEKERFDIGRLELEVSESTVVRDLDASKTALAPLRAAGVKITLDNFGTGYSTLYHVKEFQFDKVKIDRRFTENLQADDADRMMKALAGLGRGLGMVVSAEGVEDSSVSALLESGIGQTQSSAPPVSLQDVNDMFSVRRVAEQTAG